MTTDRFSEAGQRGTPLADELIVDAHGHIGRKGELVVVSSSLEVLRETMDRIGIDVFGVSAYMGFHGAARRGNDQVIEACEEMGGRLFGYMCCDVGYPDEIRPELERCLANGLKAIKIWNSVDRPDFVDYDHPNYRRVFEFADHHVLPVLAHTWGAELDQLEPAIRAYPRITWLLAHAGSRNPEKYARIASRYPNVYLETCLSASPRGLIEYFVGQGLVDKIIWGSDSSFLSATHQIGRVLFARITADEKAKILGRNAAQTLPLPRTHQHRSDREVPRS